MWRPGVSDDGRSPRPEHDPPSAADEYVPSGSYFKQVPRLLSLYVRVEDQEYSVALSIVTKDRFRTTVETLLQVDLDAFDDVIVVDDSEGPSLGEWCRDRPISYFEGPGHNRQAARNLAIDKCEADLMAFVDDDVLLPTDFAGRVRRAFERRPEAVAIGGPTLSDAPEGARDVCYRRKMTVNRWTGTVHDDSYRWVPSAPREVDLLKGANMIVKRAALESIGGFDLAFGGPAQREETDVCVRIARLGPIVYDPSLVCFHKQTGGSGFSGSQVEWRFRNHGYFVRKNFGTAVFLFGFLGVFLRLCGNPESFVQLVFRRVVLRQSFSIPRVLYAYFSPPVEGEPAGIGA